jgi:hypothetical protein
LLDPEKAKEYLANANLSEDRKNKLGVCVLIRDLVDDSDSPFAFGSFP